MPAFSKPIIEAAIFGFEEQKKSIDAQIAELRSMLTGTPGAATKQPAAKGGRKKFSPAAIERMREAQQRRWAQIRGEAPAKKAAKPAKKAAGLTEAGRKKLSQLMKKRWAAKRAAAK